MSDRSNITLALPRDLLRKLRLLAVEKETSVSGLLTSVLKDLVAREDAYGKAWRRASARMEGGFNLGTNGSLGWSRDEIHER